MDDVLLAYLRSRRLGQDAGLSAGDAATATAAPKPPDVAGAPADPFLKPSLPYPLCAIAAVVDGHREYAASCRQLGELLKKLSGQMPLEDVLLQVLRARLPRVWMERFLLILLDVRPSDAQTAAYALQFRHLRRLLFRVDRRKRLNEAEGQLARELIRALNLHGWRDIDAHCDRAVAAFRAVQAVKPTAADDLGLLIYLLRCEAAAMGERRRWLEGELLPEHPDAIARLTPHLKLLEERIQRTQELTARLGRSEPPREAPMGLEEALGPFFFSHLREALGRLPELAELRQAVELQRARLVPVRDLTALATLCRWIQEARGLPGGPLGWIRSALEAWDGGHFRVDVTGALPAIEPLLAEAKVATDGRAAVGNFGEDPYSTWVARDGLTRPFRSQNPDRLPPDVRHTVLSNIHRDGILLRLLENPAVQSTPGLVESIVELSRSPAVHARIASRPELHAGPVNGRVPVALLKSPVTIPTALLRTLIHPSRVPVAELKALWRARSTLRADAAEEVARCLRQAGAL